MSVEWDRFGRASMPADDFACGRVEGVLTRRVLAYLADLCILAVLAITLWIAVAVLTVLSLGLLSFLTVMLPFTAIMYHALLVGGPASATWGMRLAGIQLMRRDGRGPSYAEAVVQGTLFYFSMAVSHLVILVVPLLDRRHRMLHDMATGLIAVRRVHPTYSPGYI